MASSMSRELAWQTSLTALLSNGLNTFLLMLVWRHSPLTSIFTASMPVPMK
jgi:hypothetical protein